MSPLSSRCSNEITPTRVWPPSPGGHTDRHQTAVVRLLPHRTEPGFERRKRPRASRPPCIGMSILKSALFNDNVARWVRIGCRKKKRGKSLLRSRSSSVLYSGNEVLEGSINPSTTVPVDCPFRCPKIRSISIHRPGRKSRRYVRMRTSTENTGTSDSLVTHNT